MLFAEHQEIKSVVWCKYDIVVVFMLVSGGGRVVLEVVYVPCDSESNENKLEPRILLIFLPDRKYCLCRLDNNYN